MSAPDTAEELHTPEPLRTTPGGLSPTGSRAWLFARIESRCRHLVEVIRAKNADYAGKGAGDTFKNFDRVEALGIATTEQGFLTRMTDKLCRITTLTTTEGEVKDESIHDTCEDLAAYALLLSAYIAQKKAKP